MQTSNKIERIVENSEVLISKKLRGRRETLLPILHLNQGDIANLENREWAG